MQTATIQVQRPTPKNVDCPVKLMVKNAKQGVRNMGYYLEDHIYHTTYKQEKWIVNRNNFLCFLSARSSEVYFLKFQHGSVSLIQLKLGFGEKTVGMVK